MKKKEILLLEKFMSAKETYDKYYDKKIAKNKKVVR